jgi:hypothetical protein
MSSGVGPAHKYIVLLHLCNASNGGCDNNTTLYVPWSMAHGVGPARMYLVGGGEGVGPAHRYLVACDNMSHGLIRNT